MVDLNLFERSKSKTKEADTLYFPRIQQKKNSYSRFHRKICRMIDKINGVLAIHKTTGSNGGYEAHKIKHNIYKFDSRNLRLLRQKTSTASDLAKSLHSLPVHAKTRKQPSVYLIHHQARTFLYNQFFGYCRSPVVPILTSLHAVTFYSSITPGYKQSSYKYRRV